MMGTFNLTNHSGECISLRLEGKGEGGPVNYLIFLDSFITTYCHSWNTQIFALKDVDWMAYLYWHEYLILNAALYWFQSLWQSKRWVYIDSLLCMDIWYFFLYCFWRFKFTGIHRSAADATLKTVTPYTNWCPTRPGGGAWQKAVKKLFKKEEKSLCEVLFILRFL